MKFFKLWTPFKIGNIEIKNRFVIPAMHLSSSEGGFMHEDIVEFYRVRAEGGFGFIIVGGIGVSQRGQGVPLMLSIKDDKFIPGLKQLTDAVHKAGAKVCAQLYHAGAYAFSKITGLQSVSSSAIYSKFTHEMPRELTTEEVGEVIDVIAETARRSADAGFDGVELLSSAGYLMDQFLSPVKNKRTDKYGGKTLEERLTFPLELITAVKKKVGDRIIVGVRFSGDDFVEGSNTYREKIIIAQAYEKAGIQYFNCTGGWHETRIPQIIMNTPRGAYTFIAKEIKKVVNVPVFASNRINDPVMAENLLQDQYADAICFGRPSIADPQLPLKVKNNNLKELRYCVGCNQGCFDGVFSARPLNCMVNPTAMVELKYKNNKTVPNAKKIVIIGGGPAGLEAAKTATELGHKVILFEKSDKLGGQVNVSWIPPGRHELKNILDYYKYQLDKLGVDIRLNQNVSTEQVLAENPDVIFCATGVHFNMPPIKGIDGSQNCNICFADEALAGDCLVGNKVVVVGGAATGVETAIWAKKKGAMDAEVAKFLAYYKGLTAEEAMARTFTGDRDVSLLEYMPKIGSSIGKSTKWVFLDELDHLGVKLHTYVDIYEFKDNSVFFKSRVTEDGDKEVKGQIDNVDTIILATGVKPNRDMFNKFKEIVKNKASELKVKPDVKILGDAKRVGTILDAVHSGFKAAWKLRKVE
jgi:2,4-dienoyl-CoA reductase-like NADH-dependent reductase (Old Yellow Enzyme family)/NADPH-dependent glutamate synthase beta subunit-like oxidoreductase